MSESGSLDEPPKPGPPGFDPRYLRGLCDPRTVFDVGVGYGTPALYKAYPDARFLLIEPLEEYSETLEEIAENYDSEVIFNAVGSSRGSAQMVVDLDDLHKSSFSDRTSLTSTGNTLQNRTVEVTTLDQIFTDRPDLQSPILIKLDTEGNELEVLKGAVSLLQKTEIVIAEVSIADRFEGSYRFEDILFFMKANGFYLFSFLKIAHVPGEVRPRFADVVFKRA